MERTTLRATRPPTATEWAPTSPGCESGGSGGARRQSAGPGAPHQEAVGEQSARGLQHGGPQGHLVQPRGPDRLVKPGGSTT